MQTTLLGLGIAIVAALLAALGAPLFVDWNGYRAGFESRLSALAGAPVRIAGPIDASLLPTPGFRFRDVRVGEGDDAMTVGEVRGLLVLGALLKGELRAEEVVLTAPRLRLTLDGRGRTEIAGLPPGSERIAVERLTIAKGDVEVHDVWTGRRLALSDIDLRGEVRSLAGPMRLEGQLTLDGTRAAVRLSTGRRGEDGAMRLRLAAEPARGPVVEIDGQLHVSGGAPRFEGTFAATRLAAAGGAVARLRATGTLLATPESARMDKLGILYGPEDRALELEGAATVSLGRVPRLDAVLTARQLDLDRAAGAAAGASAGPPLGVLAGLAAGVESLGASGLAARVAMSADGVVVGGETLRDVRLDVASRGEAWSIDLLEARLPGRTLLKLSGETDAAGRFAGPVTMDAQEPHVFLRWLEGAGAAPLRGGALKLDARLDVRPGEIRVENLKADIGGARMEGRLAWAAPGTGTRGRLDADIRAEALDLDALAAIAGTAGVPILDAVPGDVRLALALGRARYGGLDAARVEARLAIDRASVAIERLRVEDYGGVSVDGRGRMGGLDGQASGRVTFDVTAQRADGLAALARAFGGALPQDAVRHLAAMAAPARFTLAVAADGGPSLTAVVRGQLAAGRFALNAEIPVADARRARIAASLEDDEAARLLSAFGLSAKPGGGGRIALDLGPREGDGAPVRLRVSTASLEAEARGTARLADGRVDPDLAIDVARGDLVALVPRLAPGPMPFSGRAVLRRAGEGFALSGIDARFAGERVAGDLALARAEGWSVGGRLDLDSAHAATLLGPLIGEAGAASGWSGESFGAPAAADIALDIALGVRALGLRDALAVSQAALTLRHAAPRTEIVLAGSRFAGGSLSGRAVLVRGEGGLAVEMRAAADAVDLALLVPREPGEPKPAGRATLRLDATGAGRNPLAIVSALAGQGTLRLDGLEWPGLSPAVFADLDALGRDGKAPDERQVTAAVAGGLARGPLKLAGIEVPLSLVAGQVRTGTVRVAAEGARASGSLAIDLARLSAKAALDLAPAGASLPGDAAIGLQWDGPLPAPPRTLDLTDLVTGLSLAAVERETRLLEERELRRVPLLMPPPVEAPPPLVTGPAGTLVPETELAPPPPPPPAAARPRPPAPPRPNQDWLDRVSRDPEYGRFPEPPPGYNPRPVAPRYAPSPSQPARPAETREAAPALPPPVVIGPPPGGASGRPPASPRGLP